MENNIVIVKQSDTITWWFDYKGFRAVIKKNSLFENETYHVGTVFSSKNKPWKSIPTVGLESNVKMIIECIDESQP